RDRRLHASGCARLLEEVLQRQGVHHGAEHAHVVGTAAVHAALAQLRAAEEVATADHDRDLDLIHRCGDVTRDLTDDVGVDAQLSGPECFAGELEKDASASGAFSHGWVVLSSRFKIVPCGHGKGVRI